MKERILELETEICQLRIQEANDEAQHAMSVAEKVIDRSTLMLGQYGLHPLLGKHVMSG